MVVMSELPEIITELISKAKLDEPRHFDMFSLIPDKSLEDVFNNLDRSMRFFSVYVFMEPIDDDLWEDSRYVEKGMLLKSGINLSRSCNNLIFMIFNTNKNTYLVNKCGSFIPNCI